MNFTESQRRAIEHDGRNLQLIACAGSGKTEVVARRVVHLLERADSLQPGNIIAFTFTDKAAAELYSPELRRRVHVSSTRRAGFRAPDRDDPARRGAQVRVGALFEARSVTHCIDLTLVIGATSSTCAASGG